MKLDIRIDIARVKQMALNRYHGNKLDVNGPEHWERAWQNAQVLIPQTKANATVVELFCYLHDCCRIHHGQEPGHGLAASKFIEEHKGEFSFLSEKEYQLLLKACGEHTFLQHSDEPTIATCWDANRLDIGRIGICPKEQFLITPAAKDLKLINAAYQNSIRAK
jgi:uncharacterized protein